MVGYNILCFTTAGQALDAEVHLLNFCGASLNGLTIACFVRLVRILHCVTFAIFNKESHCDSLLTAINSSHHCLNFTFEKEVDGKLLFLDVLVEKADPNFFMFSDEKPTCGPSKRKTNLVGILVHRDLSFSSKPRLPHELINIKTILCENGHVDKCIQISMSKVVAKCSD